MYVHVRLLSADALKLWARLRRRYTLVSQPTDHPRTSLSLGKVDAPSTKLTFKMEGASFLHFLNTPLWQGPLTLAQAGSLSRDNYEGSTQAGSWRHGKKQVVSWLHLGGSNPYHGTIMKDPHKLDPRAMERSKSCLGRENPRIGLQKAPGQDLAQNGRFGSIPY